MTWYESQAQKTQLKSIISERPINPTKLLSNDIFIKHITKDDPEVLAFIEANYQPLFGCLLNFCLVLPKQSDSEDRKFKFPRQAINLLEIALDTSTMKSNMTASITASVVNKVSTCKISNPEVINFIIMNMFIKLFQNRSDQLLNTLIPGYFQQLFMFLVHSYQEAMVNCLKNSHNFEQLIKKYSDHPQIIGCVQEVLVVHFNSNILASVNVSVKGGGANYPLYLKYQLLNRISTKLANSSPYEKQNLITVLIQILKNNSQICDGNLIGGQVCKLENINLYWKIANENNQYEYEHELKAIQLMKWVVKCNNSFDKININHIFGQLVNYVLDGGNVGIRFIQILQLLTEWISTQSLNLNTSVYQSSSFMLNSAQKQINPQIQEILIKKPLFSKLIRLCIDHPNNNILHKRIQKFFFVVFQAQNSNIIDSIYKENNIIYESTRELKDFKKQGYFGPIISIIEIFSKRRIDTDIVKEAIKHNHQQWNEVFVKVLQPYSKKLMTKLGQLSIELPHKEVEYKVTKKREKMKEQKKQVKIQQKKQEQQQKPQPIKINIKKQTFDQENEEKNQSFETYMKRKMSESDISFRKRSKSKTPTKLKSTKEKKNKWGNQENEQRKASSSSAKIQSLKKDQSPPKLKLIKIKKEQYPAEKRSRRLSAAEDNTLIAVLKKMKENKIR